MPWRPTPHAQDAEGKSHKHWFDLSTLKEPYRIEGRKTMGLELAEQLGWELPDVIFMILDAVRASGGMAIAVPEQGIAPWMKKAISLEGLSICP